MKRVGDKIQLVDNHLKSLANHRRSKTSGKIPVGTRGEIIASRPTSGTLEYLVKFIGHGGFRFVRSKNIKK